MTLERMVHLLKIELECLQRNKFGIGCDRNCETCDIVQDTNELITMYKSVIDLLQTGGAGQ